MELFPRQPRTILDELTTLENMMPSYNAELMRASKFIRNRIWGKIDDNILREILSVCNTVFSYWVKEFGEEFEFFSDYVIAFINAVKKHSNLDIYEDFMAVLNELWEAHLKTIALRQWIQLDPSRQAEFSETELREKNLLDIMDDFWNMLTPESAKAFLHPLKTYPKLIRGRKNRWTKAEELAAPSLDTIEKYHIINRWTPHGKRYLYLVDGNDPLQNPDKVCMEEMRISDPTLDVTIADFSVCPATIEKQILDLNYEAVSVEEIILQNRLNLSIEANRIMHELRAKANVSSNRIRKQIRQHRTETQILATIYCGQMFLKQICSAIFIPLDAKDDADPVLKEKCYKSFHLFAEWCENKGIIGIR